MPEDTNTENELDLGPEHDADDHAQPVDRAAGILMEALLDQVKHMPKSWAELNHGDRLLAFNRMKDVVSATVAFIVREVAAREFPVVQASVANVNFKGEVVEAKVLTVNTNQSHELADYTLGGKLMIVLASPDEYMGGIADQRDNLGEEDGQEQMEFDAPPAEREFPDPDWTDDQWGSAVQAMMVEQGFTMPKASQLKKVGISLVKDAWSWLDDVANGNDPGERPEWLSVYDPNATEGGGE